MRIKRRKHQILNSRRRQGLHTDIQLGPVLHAASKFAQNCKPDKFAFGYRPGSFRFGTAVCFDKMIRSDLVLGMSQFYNP